MTQRSIIARKQAQRDIHDTVTYYLDEAGQEVALGFIEALKKAYDHISRHPGTGSPRYAHELRLPGLRAWPLTRYPYLVFYRDETDHIDVWRVLHRQRDIPA
ncbi:MAG: type II toxin-antitoxin system RelE/ParE family toxin [Curvibacter sp.]|nr:MAG: type II toxin-antitoxin system RelE/ParE family toxin [Curvibacter sp.]